MGLYDTTLGTLLVGIFFNTFLYGLVTYQFAAYYQAKFNDSPAIKCMVSFLFILDTFHSTSVIYMAWSYAVTNFDNPAALQVAEWPHALTPVATALAALMTQIYLGYRILRLTKSKFLFGVVILLAIPSFILGIACSIGAWMIKVLSELIRTKPFAISWLCTQVVLDTFITVILVIVFWRSKTGLQRTNSILNRFIRAAIQTGFFSSIFSLANLITFVMFPRMNLFAMFAIPQGRIYTNTLLDVLLVRRLLMKDSDGVLTVSRGLEFDTLIWGAVGTQAVSTMQPTSIQFDVKSQSAGS